MVGIGTVQSLSDHLKGGLPYLRRYARTLVGEQAAGDEFALRALNVIMDNPDMAASASSPKVGLFQAFFAIWQSDNFGTATEADKAAAKAQSYLRKLTPHSRHALLLRASEGFPIGQVAEIMGRPEPEIERLIDVARQELKNSIKGSILIIEDEAMIAMDLQDIVEEMGHRATGSAPTHQQALQLAQKEVPDLILSDIKLADGSSGIEAVDEILEASAPIPVIFVTAFPELLLTGARKEPAFVITKPYGEEQVQSAISQAMFFRSTDVITI